MAAFVLQGIIYNAINMMEIADKTLVSVLGKILLVAILGLLVSCNNSQDPYAVKKVGSTTPKTAVREISMEKVQLDSVYCSFSGSSSMNDFGEILYYDKYFNYLYTFSSEGKYLRREIGKGRGPGETTVGQGSEAVFSNNGALVLLGSTMDYDYFPLDRLNHNYFNTYGSYDHDSVTPDNFDTYSFAEENFVGRLKDGTLYLSSFSDNELFCYFTTPEKYLTDSYRIGRVDLIKGENKPMIVKGFPEMYRKTPAKYSSCQYIDFDISDEGDIYVGFEASPVIYVCNHEGVPKYSFGLEGRDIKDDYVEGMSFEDFDYYVENRNDKGRYGWLEFIDKTGMTFRSYVKSGAAESDGLQAYSTDKDLIGDFDVPKGLNVVGYAEPYYYSQVFEDDEVGELYVYRFKL